MKKLNEKGFMLVETLIVSVFVGVTLIILYIQLQNISNSYDKTFSYNTATSLYNTSKVKKYLFTRNMGQINNEVLSNSSGFIDISSCSNSFYKVGEENAVQATNYCKKIYERLRIVQVLVTKDDLTDVRNKIVEAGNNEKVSSKMVDFVRYIKNEKKEGYLRIIIEFEDENNNSTFGTTLISTTLESGRYDK